MIESSETVSAVETPPARPGAISMFGRWIVEGARTAVFLRPRWRGIEAGPWIAATLMIAWLLLLVLVERFYIPGAAEFQWRAILDGWFYTILILWICYLLRPQHDGLTQPDAAPDAAHMFCMALAQSFFALLVTGAVFGSLTRAGYYTTDVFGAWGVWAIWAVPMIWSFAALWTLFWRSGERRRAASMMVALLVLAVGSAGSYWAAGKSFWYAKEEASPAARNDGFQLTQEVMEAQPRLLEDRLRALKAQRAGTIDLYALTYAPYAWENVFMRESDMVANVMAKRFDASGRTLQLVNNEKTVGQWPWATPLNLQRAIQRVGKLMNREEDILFLHLTSHGAADGELSTSFWPMTISGIRPAELKSWLDQAGIKNRVISVSACFSGTWIEPLADDHTLVMTAADSSHTSYGCGRKSDLTYFGRAMYDEQLRNNTLSFEDAHRAARPVIKEREEKAGKMDGYSNPQIKTGDAIRGKLARLQERLSGAK